MKDTPSATELAAHSTPISEPPNPVADGYWRSSEEIAQTKPAGHSHRTRSASLEAISRANRLPPTESKADVHRSLAESPSLDTLPPPPEASHAIKDAAAWSFFDPGKVAAHGPTLEEELALPAPPPSSTVCFSPERPTSPVLKQTKVARLALPSELRSSHAFAQEYVL